MKKYLKYCLYFVLPILIVAIPLEYMARQVPNPYKYKFDWMQKNAENVEVLIFGSSHTFYGIRPDYISGTAFNLANASQDIELDYYLLQNWADRYKKLKTVICPISFSTWFGKGLEYGSESYRCRYYKIYMKCDLYSDFSLNNLEVSNLRTALGKIEKMFTSKGVTGYDEYGWGKAYLLSNKDVAKWNDGTEAEAAVKRHTHNNWDYIENNYAMMKKIAEFCKRRNIQFVLVTTPCWHSYYNKLNDTQLNKMYELTHKIQNEYNNISYLDYLKDSRFEADDFYDSNHLSDIGSIKFTKILNKDIQSLHK